MKLKLWGVRGSIPTPLSGETIKSKIKYALTNAKLGDISSEESINSYIESLPFYIKSTYGGNTTSMEVVTDSGELIIIDCGSGLKNLGKELMAGDFGTGKGHANIFLTHTHWDHIQGVPFFVPFFVPGNVFNIYSSVPDLKERLDHQQVFTHFPIDLNYMLATKNFFEIETDSEFFLNDTRIFVKMMPHPGGSYGIRIEDKGKTFVYSSDCEFNLEEIDKIESFKELFENADLVIFDTQYTFDEAINKLDWGHSSASIAIDIATTFNVKRLLLFHHDPEYDDEKLENVLSSARSYMHMKTKRGHELEVDIAIEGMVVNI
ncbi:MBL fold metallo-hydrolase [Spirochaetota bacterium]